MKTVSLQVFHCFNDYVGRGVGRTEESGLIICQDFIRDALGWLPKKANLILSLEPMRHSKIGLIHVWKYPFQEWRFYHHFENGRIRGIFARLQRALDRIVPMPKYELVHEPYSVYVCVVPVYEGGLS